MEDINIPLRKGKLDEIETSPVAASQDAMETDEPSQSSRSSLRDDSIVVNYNILPDHLKNLDDPNDIKAKRQDLIKKINQLETELSRCPAPNMKAVSR